jgi:hypothetical protein
VKAFVIGTSLFTGLVVAALLRFEAAAPQPMSRDELIRVVRAVASIARETVLFSEQLEDERLSAAFAKIHREKLAEILDEERDKLETTMPAPLVSSGDNARALAAELSSRLAELQRHLADRDGIARIRQEVRGIESRLGRLEAAS